MKAKRSLFLIILIITIRAGFAQEVSEKTEYLNLVKNGDFESGATGFKSDFIFTEEDFLWGYYVITDSIAKYDRGLTLTFNNPGVTFQNPISNTGKYYAIQVNNSGKQRLWYDSIIVKPNTTYEFSCILANINIRETPAAYIILKINWKACCPARSLSESPAWERLSIQYKTGPDETRIEISIVDEIWTMGGNDVALDNIVFKEIPPEKFIERKFK
jgi:hypothetical protein